MRALPWLIDVADAVIFGVNDGPELGSMSIGWAGCGMLTSYRRVMCQQCWSFDAAVFRGQKCSVQDVLRSRFHAAGARRREMG
jgi:hypothetical protein